MAKSTISMAMASIAKFVYQRVPQAELLELLSPPPFNQKPLGHRRLGDHPWQIQPGGWLRNGATWMALYGAIGVF